MKRYLLIASHLGANSQNLCAALDRTDSIQWIRNGFVFTHPSDLNSFFSGINHKFSNSLGVFTTELLYNYQLTHKGVCEFCNFIYLIREPKTAVRIANPNFATVAVNYYIFRLRRIYEMARETKGAIFLTWDDLVNKNGFSFILEKLKLDDPLRFREVPNEKSLLSPPSALLKEANLAYDLCLFRLRKLKNLNQI